MNSYEKYTKPTMPETMANIDSPSVKAETVKIILLDIDETLMRLNDELFDINNAVDNVDDPRNTNVKSPDTSIIDTLRRIRENASLAVRQAINIRERLW